VNSCSALQLGSDWKPAALASETNRTKSEGGDVDYYEYISDSKVDILLPQVPTAFKQKIAIEVGVNLKVFSAKASTEHTTLEDRVSRVRVVARHLQNTEATGGIANPKPWIADRKIFDVGLLGREKKL
jgi:hypothetical protein